MNIALVTGHMGNNPNVRTLQGGKGEFKAADFSVAVDMTHRKSKDEVVWVKVQALGWAAEYAEKYLKKGSLVMVRGELQENKFKDKDGKEVRVWHIQAEEVKQMWSAKGDNAVYTPTPEDSDDLPY
jgi:single-strand DNA-binding protein